MFTPFYNYITKYKWYALNLCSARTGPFSSIPGRNKIHICSQSKTTEFQFIYNKG